jgi:signal transduction histidine kinase
MEALVNAVRHSDGHTIEVRLEWAASALHLSVRDDGRGIDPAIGSEARRPGHFGLVGMRERAEAIGARLTIDSAPGAGTEVTVSIPC